MAAATRPIVFTLPGCPSCKRLKADWAKEGIAFEEREVNADQSVLDEALKYGDTVPIILFPDGRVEVGYKNMMG